MKNLDNLVEEVLESVNGLSIRNISTKPFMDTVVLSVTRILFNKEGFEFPTRVLVTDIDGVVGTVSVMEDLGYTKVDGDIVDISIYNSFNKETQQPTPWPLFKGKGEDIVLVTTKLFKIDKRQSNE